MWENELTALSDNAKIYSLRYNYIALKTLIGSRGCT